MREVSRSSIWRRVARALCAPTLFFAVCAAPDTARPRAARPAPPAPPAQRRPHSPRKHKYVISKPLNVQGQPDMYFIMGQFEKELRKSVSEAEFDLEYLEYDKAITEYKRNLTSDVLAVSEGEHGSRHVYHVWLACKKDFTKDPKNEGALAKAPCGDTKENCRQRIFLNLSIAVRTHHIQCHVEKQCERRQ